LGKTFAGRVAASLLKAIGLPELIARDLNEYEALALELAATPQKLLALRQILAANLLTHPLFNTALFTKHLESAYMSMWKRHREGLPPDNILVESLSPQPSSLATAQASI
jgi:protein O-GlcNAc transferase